MKFQVAGVIATMSIVYDAWGKGLDTLSLIEEKAPDDSIYITNTTKDLLNG